MPALVGYRALWVHSHQISTTHCFFSVSVASTQTALSSSIYVLILSIWAFFTVVPAIVCLARSRIFPLISGRPPTLRKIKMKLDIGIKHLYSRLLAERWRKFWKDLNQEECENRTQISGTSNSVINICVVINKILIFAGNILQTFLLLKSGDLLGLACLLCLFVALLLSSVLIIIVVIRLTIILIAIIHWMLTAKCMYCYHTLAYFFKLVLKREEGGKREKKGARGVEGREGNINLFFHLFVHSSVASWMCPDWGSNLQTWHIGTML